MTLISKPKSQTYFRTELLLIIILDALSSVTFYNNVSCVEYNEFQRWASGVYEFSSEITDSAFHFDFEECNICLKSKYFDVIPVKLHARNEFYFVKKEH